MRHPLQLIGICVIAVACGSSSSNTVTPSPTPAPVPSNGPFTLRGHVFDAVTKMPLDAMTISISVGFDMNGASGGFTTTDAQGAYELPNRRAGQMRLLVFGRAGYNLVDQTIDLTRDTTLDFAMTVLVPATYTLSGRVTDIDTSLPLAGVSMDVVGMKNGTRSMTTAADGSYRFPGLFIEGFILSARYPGYDTEFRGVQQSSDSMLDIQMRREMELLSGTWTGTWTYTTSDGLAHTEQIPQMEVAQTGMQISGGVPTPQVGNGFDGTIGDLSAIGTTTQVTGTIRWNFASSTGRQFFGCTGSGAFTGRVSWNQLGITAPQLMFPCTAPYTNVTLSLVRQH